MKLDPINEMLLILYLSVIDPLSWATYDCAYGIDYVLLPFLIVGETYASSQSGTEMVAVRL